MIYLTWLVWVYDLPPFINVSSFSFPFSLFFFLGGGGSSSFSSVRFLLSFPSLSSLFSFFSLLSSLSSLLSSFCFQEVQCVQDSLLAFQERKENKNLEENRNRKKWERKRKEETNKKDFGKCLLSLCLSLFGFSSAIWNLSPTNKKARCFWALFVFAFPFFWLVGWVWL